MHEEINAYVPTPEEIRNNMQIQQSAPPMQQEQPQSQDVPQTEESEQKEENPEVSRFGSAWDQNVNGRE